MPGIRGAGSLLIAAAILVILFAQDSIGGLTPSETAMLLGLGGVALILAAGIVEGFRRHWTFGVQAIAVSCGVLASFLVLYVFRGELLNSLDRAIGDISMGRTVAVSDTEAVAARRTDGSFVVRGQVNGRGTRFIFDTGASTVVLRAENAASLGFHPEALDYSIPVSTANGAALAAPVTIETMSIGPITERDVQALVVRPGVLHANLLGMTFLERLGSYEVRGNRLILRGKEEAAE
ncbi:TIGR02281 family clan AA aspartic protease [Microvirga roseola]|uniref:TIGR02281 family clan AA aspartic protease n=1 Tax=Microvirga roseola TaxID=2883126 RepID=UPI001E62D458|nr:TIGR02281 family clan AA aspartic protease [Microvirga roseola]